VSLRGVQLAYSAGGRVLLRGVDVEVQPGQLLAILGPNGAGKSTLLRLLAREWRPASGQLTLNGRDLAGWEAQALAHQRAVLPQSEALRFAFTVTQVVALGRLPCRQHAAAREAEIIDAALRLTDALHLRERLYPTLSGGERQRVQLARVLVQIWEEADAGARYLLLDEPTAALDLKHQHDCLRVARRFAAQGLGVAAVLHDPNLALQYADAVLLLRDGRVVAAGPPAAVMTREHLSQVYEVDVDLLTVNGRPLIAVH
jgi:iron complex transport system ATP-binding protein